MSRLRPEPGRCASLAAFPRLVQTSCMTRFLTVACLVVFLAGCGFHLRDSLTLPPDIGPIRVVAKNQYSPLADALAVSLQRAGGQASAEGPVDGKATLNIRFELWGNTPLSIDQFGRAQEYELRYATAFDLRDAAGTVIVPEQTIELGREYLDIPTQSDGTESEREILAKEMEREMVSAILRRIDVVSKAPQPAAADSLPTP